MHSRDHGPDEILYYRLRRISSESTEESCLRREVKKRKKAALKAARQAAHRRQWSAVVDYLAPQDYTRADKDENVLIGAAKELFRQLKNINPHLRVYLDFARKPEALAPSLAIFLDWSQEEPSLLDESRYNDEQDNNGCWGC